jgi:hypothetical protein
MMKPKSKPMKVGWEQKRVLNQDGHKGLDWMNWMSNKNVDDELALD